jgi:hypothetical protein
MEQEAINVYGDEIVLSLLSRGDFIHFIPGWRLDRKKAKTESKLIFKKNDKTIIKIYSPKKFLAQGRFEDLKRAETIPYLIHYILERERGEKGKMTIHAAAVSKQGKGILILGKQGSGKTSISLELCRNHGYSLIGNDLILAGFRDGKGSLHGGTKIFQIRETTLQDYNKDLRKFLKKKAKNEDEWTNRAAIEPKKIKVKVETEVIPIEAIYYVHLYPPKHFFVTKKVDILFSKLYLYQIFSEYIRSSVIVPLTGEKLNYGCYMPSLDNKKIFDLRTKFIEWITLHHNYRYIAGSISGICTYIDKNTQKRD